MSEKRKADLLACRLSWEKNDILLTKKPRIFCRSTFWSWMLPIVQNCATWASPNDICHPSSVEWIRCRVNNCWFSTPNADVINVIITFPRMVRGRAYIKIRHRNGSNTDPHGTPLRIGEGPESEGPALTLKKRLEIRVPMSQYLARNMSSVYTADEWPAPCQRLLQINRRCNAKLSWHRKLPSSRP